MKGKTVKVDGKNLYWKGNQIQADQDRDKDMREAIKAIKDYDESAD